jgi:D-alanine-D-alanine ligase
MVKPVHEDASHGISLESVCPDAAAARARARYVIERYRQPALVEEFVDGREFNISVLGEGVGARTLELMEIDYSDFPAGAPHLITYNAKWEEESAECTGSKPVPARDLDPELAARIRSAALGAYRAIGLRDYGRVDIRLHPEAGPLVLDVNSNPDISPGAGLARAAARSGLPYVELVGGVVEAAAARASPLTGKL